MTSCSCSSLLPLLLNAAACMAHVRSWSHALWPYLYRAITGVKARARQRPTSSSSARGSTQTTHIASYSWGREGTATVPPLQGGSKACSRISMDEDHKLQGPKISFMAVRSVRSRGRATGVNAPHFNGCGGSSLNRLRSSKDTNANCECEHNNLANFNRQPKSRLRSFQKQGGNTGTDPCFREYARCSFPLRKKKALVQSDYWKWECCEVWTAVDLFLIRNIMDRLFWSDKVVMNNMLSFQINILSYMEGWKWGMRMNNCLLAFPGPRAFDAPKPQVNFGLWASMITVLLGPPWLY
jgi:hypothetical protein